MYAGRVRAEALDLLRQGASLSTVARATGVARSTIREWRDHEPRSRPDVCPRCEELPIDQEAYSALLGFYLGDGYIAKAARYYFLRITCDLAHPRIIDDVVDLLGRVRPGGKVFMVKKSGCVDIQANWQHWPCLFPQHGPGRKHDREITLKPWQQEIVSAHPGPFLRGLFHSDGCRVSNWATRVVAGEKKRYEYGRWQFTNHSDDIRNLCTATLDLVGIPWRQSSWKTISVSRREAVAALDALIGPKK